MAILSQPSGLKAGQVQEPWCLWTGSRKHPRFYQQGQAPALLPPSPFPSSTATAGAQTDTQHFSCHGTLCSAVLGKRWSVILSLPGRQHMGRNSPSSKLAHSPPCLLVIIVTPRARNPLQTEHQSFRTPAITKANPQVSRELIPFNNPTW